MKRDVIEEGTATTADGYTVTVKGLSEDKDAGVASVANRGSVDLHIEGPGGFVLDLHLAGPESVKLVRPLVTGSVLTETEADVARRYLRDHSEHMYPYQMESLKRQAGMEYDQDILDEAMRLSADS